MDAQQIRDIAKTYVDSMMQQGMTKTELAMLLGIIQARVYGVMFQDGMTVTGATASNTVTKAEIVRPSAERPIPPPLKSKGIQYDPMYDPAPPFSSDTPPPRESAPGVVIARTGAGAFCNACKHVVYTVNRDIPNNCAGDEFIASFTPMAGAPPLPERIEIQHIDDKIVTDCPKCGAHKALYLTGV